MNQSIRRRYNSQRAEGMPAQVALTIARWLVSDTRHDFMSDLDTDKRVTGAVGPFDVEVRVEYDDDSRIGDDDVTGTFSAATKRPGPEWVRNSATGWTAGADAMWYRPCAYALSGQYFVDARNMGMTKSVARDYERACIRRDMTQDADRSYYGVHATVSIDGHEIAGSSLWGIDHIGGESSDRYIRDMGDDQVDEAIEEAWRVVPARIERLAATRDKLVAAYGETRDKLVAALAAHESETTD